MTHETGPARPAVGTGLFSHRQNHGARRQLSPETKINIFAEHISETARAAKAMGISPAYGRVLLGKIRKRLGWQAV